MIMNAIILNVLLINSFFNINQNFKNSHVFFNMKMKPN